jgi:SAM-dependent methyltransferase
MSRSIYYTRRTPVRPQEFEEGYWGVVRDPDGKERDLAKERGKKLEDLESELAFVNRLPPGRILDVGCGLGYFLSGVDPRWQRFGVEISDYAAEKAREYGTIFHGELRRAKYEDRSFDVVTLYHVIEHMEDPERELEEIKRVLRPGGFLVVGTPNFDSACARRFGEKFRMLHDWTHISLFSAESLRRLLEDHGFVVEWEDFPFFDTRYFTKENLERLFDEDQMSPPFYGSIMTMYARLPERSSAAASLALAGRAAYRVANESAKELERAAALLDATARRGGTVFVSGPAQGRHAALLCASGRHAAPCASRLPDSAGITDALLFVTGDESLEPVLSDAKRRGMSTIALGSADTRLDATVTVAVPSRDPECVALAHDLLVSTLATPVAAASSVSVAPPSPEVVVRATGTRD